MYLVAWLFMGTVVGLVAGISLKGNGYGPLMDLAMGVGGAIAGGFVLQSVGISSFGGNLLTVIVAIACALLLTSLVALMNGRRLHAR